MSDKQNASDDAVNEDELELDDELTTTEDDDELDTDDEDVSVEVDGEVVSLDQIREWKSGHMMDRDYRQKTMSLADERKAVKALTETFTSKIEELDDQITSLEAAITAGDGYTDEELDELAEEDFAAYRKIERQRKEREKLLQNAKAKRTKAYEDRVPAEAQALQQSMPEWNDPKKGEATYKADMELTRKFMADIGITQKESEKLVDARYMKAFILAARYHNLKQRQPMKNVKRPKSVKPGGKPSAAPKSFASALYGK